jgi:hypothetical protein
LFELTETHASETDSSSGVRLLLATRRGRDTRRPSANTRRHLDSTMSVRERVSSVLATLPPARHAFAYGSAVLRDASVSNAERALDVVVVVDDPAQWHAENMEMNPSHYAGHMRASGVRGVDFRLAADWASVHTTTLGSWTRTGARSSTALSEKRFVGRYAHVATSIRRGADAQAALRGVGDAKRCGARKRSIFEPPRAQRF